MTVIGVSVSLCIDQLANLHFHFTSVPRCTPMTWCGGTTNTDRDTPSSLCIHVIYTLELYYIYYDRLSSLGQPDERIIVNFERQTFKNK